ncbi:hypothetical protein VTN02DRAFT_1534 [Thermoascus thermophilus]
MKRFSWIPTNVRAAFFQPPYLGMLLSLKLALLRRRRDLMKKGGRVLLSIQHEPQSYIYHIIPFSVSTRTQRTLSVRCLASPIMIFADIHPPRPLPEALGISRPSSRNSTARRSRPSPPRPRPLPDYTAVNPLIYRTSAHSFTHSWPTHRLICCPRCSRSNHSDSSDRRMRDLTSAHSYHFQSRHDHHDDDHRPLSRFPTSSSLASYGSIP